MEERERRVSDRASNRTEDDHPFRLTVVLSARSQTGGGYFQSASSLRAILQLVPDNFSITVIDVRGTFGEELARLSDDPDTHRFDIQELPAKLQSFRDRLVSEESFFFSLCRGLLRLIGREVKVSKLARFLDGSSTDLVYFVSPVPEAQELTVKPFVWTLWDLFHLDFPEFPEFRTSGKFEFREHFNSRALRKATAVVVDSQELAEKARNRYGVPPEKFVVVPYAVPISRAVPESNSRGELPSVVKSLSGNYFFYPAQFWLHKNHSRVVEAIHRLAEEGNDIHAVFVGRDFGAGRIVKSMVKRFGLKDRIHFLGYVEDSLVPSLYRECLALVMASYTGPNIPPLEAMSFKAPIIATNSHQKQLKDAALFFDPDSSQELADQMKKILDSEVRQKLIASGGRRLAELEIRRLDGNSELRRNLLVLSRRIGSHHAD